MGVSIGAFKLYCDHPGCNAKLACLNMTEAYNKGWTTKQSESDFEEREWVEEGDYAYCPNHKSK